MITYKYLSFVFVLFCHLLSVSKSQNNRILINDIKSITLRKGEYTASRKLNSIPQLECVGGSACGKFLLKLVHCYNEGYDGVRVRWNCKAQMNKDIEFGKIDVLCEGYDNSNDTYILLDSCALKYELNYTTCGNKKQPPSIATTLFLRIEIVSVVVALVVTYLVFGIMSIPYEGNKKDQFGLENCGDFQDPQRKKRFQEEEKTFDDSTVKKNRTSGGWFSSFINYFFGKKYSKSENDTKFETQTSSFSFFSKNKDSETSSSTQISLSNLLYDNQKLVDLIWNSTPEKFPLEKKCVEKYGISVFRRDLIKLKSGDWINDELINFFMELIIDRSKRFAMLPKVTGKNFRRTHSIRFFYGAYIDKGYEGVKKWTKSIDIFAYDIILIPLHMGAHWCLAVIDNALKNIEYYDSMLSDGTQCLLNLRNYLAEEYLEKKSAVLDVSVYCLQNKKEISTQEKGYDCGIFLCRFAECASRRASMKFSADSMDHFRAQMTYEIYTAKLLF